MSGDVTLTSELEDSDESPGFDWTDLQLSRLMRPVALRHFAGLAVALLVLSWPQRTTLVLGRLIGLALVVYGVTALWAALRSRPTDWLQSLASTVAIGVGGFLVAVPVETEAAIGRVVGALLIAIGLGTILATLLQHRSDVAWQLGSASALIAVGLFLVGFPSMLLAIVIVTLACLWIVVELIALSVILNPALTDAEPSGDTSTLVGQWFANRPKAAADRRRLYDELLYEGDREQAKIIRFAMLMLLASVIASMGVVSDSTAVVIGAMLIAPLMTPLMAMALSLVMGWPNRLGRSALVALGGALLAIGIGFVIGLAEFTIVDTLTNGQIVSRSNPTLVDLVIAVAAGAAGAYGLSRPDVSNSLPGVAIAIALVPPLTVIGISYSQGDWDSGNGALLLFLTNALAIMVVGGVMFLLLGVAPLSRVAENQHRVRTASAVVFGSAMLIIGALVLNGTSAATNVFGQRATQQTVAEWIAPFPEFSTVETGLSGSTVSVVLAGPVAADRPTADDLADQLSSALGREVTVDLRIRLETHETSS